MRDELSATPHSRGMVGLSTRGHHTGDAQIFVNLADNRMLDFEYTVFGEVAPEQMPIVDAIQEGTRITRIQARAGPGRGRAHGSRTEAYNEVHAHAVAVPSWLSRSHRRSPRRTSPRITTGIPKKGDPVALKGCLRGGALEATDVGAEDSSTPLLSGLTFRLTGKKDLLKEMKQKHDGRLVEVRGTLKSDLQPQAGYGTNVGGMRITIGGPTAGPAGGREAETRKSLPVVDVSGFEVPRPAAAAECGWEWWRESPSSSVALLLSPAQAGSRQALDLGAPREIASGITLYHLTDPSLLDPPAPVSIWLLRVDPGAADLRAVLANDEIVDTETVPDMAARHGALAAINAGFFLLPTGDPAGHLQAATASSSATPAGRAARSASSRDASGPRLLFGRVAATMSLRVPRRARPDAGGDRRRRHHTPARQADAVHARPITSTPTPPRRASSGSCRASRCA